MVLSDPFKIPALHLGEVSENASEIWSNDGEVSLADETPALKFQPDPREPAQQLEALRGQLVSCQTQLCGLARTTEELSRVAEESKRRHEYEERQGNDVSTLRKKVGAAMGSLEKTLGEAVAKLAAESREKHEVLEAKLRKQGAGLAEAEARLDHLGELVTRVWESRSDELRALEARFNGKIAELTSWDSEDKADLVRSARAEVRTERKCEARDGLDNKLRELRAHVVDAMERLETQLEGRLSERVSRVEARFLATKRELSAAAEGRGTYVAGEIARVASCDRALRQTMEAIRARVEALEREKSDPKPSPSEKRFGSPLAVPSSFTSNRSRFEPRLEGAPPFAFGASKLERSEAKDRPGALTAKRDISSSPAPPAPGDFQSAEQSNAERECNSGVLSEHR